MDRFLEKILSHRICPDAQIFLGRKNGKPNILLQPTSHTGQYTNDGVGRGILKSQYR